MADRDVDVLIVGGGRWPARRAPRRCARRGFERLGPARRPRADPPYERPPCSKDYLRGESSATTRYLHPAELVRGARHRAAHAHERDEARPGARRRRRCRTQGRASASTARCSPPAPTSGGCASTAATSTASTTCARSATPTRSAPTPSRRRARRAGRRLLHRLRGRGVADRDGQALHAGHAGGRAALDAASARRRARSSPACCASTGSSCVTGDALGALRGRRPRRSASSPSRGRDARRRPGRAGHRRGARRHARPLGRARARRDRRRARARRRCETSAPGVWRGRRHVRVRLRASTAAGCASSTGRSPRAQGRYVARGDRSASPTPYDEVPYFWSDLADWATLEYVGPAARVGPRGRPRLARRRRVHDLLPRAARPRSSARSDGRRAPTTSTHAQAG